MPRVALLLVALGCGNSADPVVEVIGTPGKRDVLAGTLSVDGKPVTLTACQPGRSVHTFVEVVTSAGKLRFEDQRLYWNVEPTSIKRGEPLECSKLDRSWGGGTRPNNTSYWRGTLAFTCGSITGDLTLECGDITAEERARLDKDRKDMQDEQRGSAK